VVEGALVQGVEPGDEHVRADLGDIEADEFAAPGSVGVGGATAAQKEVVEAGAGTFGRTLGRGGGGVEVELDPRELSSAAADTGACRPERCTAFRLEL
jgi:hypothetical protein